MKKNYISPKMVSVNVVIENLLGAASDGQGNRVTINNSNASSAGESRGVGGWDDEE